MYSQETPCWIEIHLHRALQLLDEFLLYPVAKSSGPPPAGRSSLPRPSQQQQQLQPPVATAATSQPAESVAADPAKQQQLCNQTKDNLQIETAVHQKHVCVFIQMSLDVPSYQTKSSQVHDDIGLTVEAQGFAWGHNSAHHPLKLTRNTPKMSFRG